MNNVSKHYTESLKFVDEYLNKKPAVKKMNPVVRKILYGLGVASKAFLRYIQIKEAMDR